MSPTKCLWIEKSIKEGQGPDKDCRSQLKEEKVVVVVVVVVVAAAAVVIFIFELYHRQLSGRSSAE
jgi:hypothetical protein